MILMKCPTSNVGDEIDDLNKLFDTLDLRWESLAGLECGFRYKKTGLM